MRYLDNICIDLNIQNDKVDQSTNSICCHQLNIKLMIVLNHLFFLFETPEKETNLKERKFGIHLKTDYFVNNDQFALNSNTNKLFWKAAVGNNQCGPVC